MTINFKESGIPESVILLLHERYDYNLDVFNVHKLYTGLFHGISCALGAINAESKDKTAKSISFYTISGEFIAAAKIEYIINDDNPSDPSAGQWNYSWSFYEEDTEDSKNFDFAKEDKIIASVINSTANVANLGYNEQIHASVTSVFLIEYLKKWLSENALEKDITTLELDGVFTATSTIVDGKVEMGLTPAGEMKVLIKNDAAIQQP